MGLFRKSEKRAEDEVQLNDILLRALLGGSKTTKEHALNIPAMQSCIKFATDTISMIPIKLYKESDGKVNEIKNDKRVFLINDETGDTLDSNQFWKAMIIDYYLGKGGYAYIKRQGNEFISLHYIDEGQISIFKNTDPIYKDYDISINGIPYKPYEFIKLLRNTKDGAQGISIIDECPLITSVIYSSLIFEEVLVRKGGNKKGFIEAPKKLAKEAMDELKTAWKNLYSNNTENLIILNEGVKFNEASSSSVEMQLNENKKTNSDEICKLFNFPTSIITGKATELEYSNAIKLGILPLIRTIECALNRDYRLEKEKQGDAIYYWAFDMKEILKGNLTERYKAYNEAVKSGWISKNEIRYIEDMEEIDGLDVVTMSLGEVIYDIKSKTYFTPNTKTTQSSDMKGGEKIEN